MTRFVLLAALVAAPSVLLAQKQEFVRYQQGTTVSYGRLEGDQIVQLRGAPWVNATPTGVKVAKAKVTLLAPAVPSKVIAVGLNYQTHLGERSAAAYPGLFAKMPTSIIADRDTVILPPDANNVHYEGEMVLIIGKRAQNVPVDKAKEYVFGVTTGNDVSERDWQKSDLQWFRAKAADTFGPLGPVIVRGVNYDDLLLQTRLNGEVVQSQRTKDLIFTVAEIVSYISRYVTLEPGDVIYSGTPGTTRQMKAGDVVEVELEQVGLLRNPVVQRKR
jgi:2-keto-4-pentenoate hydratase/2-oxohepta-3-ene-1,7-dioic acid hydratase in catechol pathway